MDRHSVAVRPRYILSYDLYPTCSARWYGAVYLAVFATNFTTCAVPFCFTAKSTKWAQKERKAFIDLFAKLYQYLHGRFLDIVLAGR